MCSHKLAGFEDLYAILNYVVCGLLQAHTDDRLEVYSPGQ